MSKKSEVKIKPPKTNDLLVPRDIASLLVRLYNIRERLYRPASLYAGVHHEILRRKLTSMKKRGYAVRPLFNYKMLGLEIVYAIFEGDKADAFIEKPFVRSVSRLYPPGDTLVVFYVPKDNLKDFLRFLKSLKMVKMADHIFYRERSAPDFEWYGITLEELCKNDPSEKLKESIERYHKRFHLRESFSRQSFAGIDLAIMAVLEREQIPPPPSLVAKKAGYKDKSVRFHYDTKVKKFIWGYRVYFKPYNILGPIYMQELEAPSKDIGVAVARAFVEHPFVSSAVVTDEDLVFITYTGPHLCSAKLTKVASSFLKHRHLYVVELVKSYTLPWIKGLEYDPHTRSWSFSIEKVMKDYRDVE